MTTRSNATTRTLLAGLSGTAVMSAATLAEKHSRGSIDHPVDYDASRHVATAVGAVLRRPPRTGRERTAYFLLAHWGYGSAVALAYPLIRRVASDDVRATAWFWVGCQTMAVVMFPTLGSTPPPWRWSRDVLLSSVALHGTYAVTVAATMRLLEPLDPAADPV